MIVRTRGGASHEIRMPSEFGSSAIQSPAMFGSWTSTTGGIVNLDKAAGVPAVLNAIRLLSGAVAMTPLRVYQGRDAQKRPVDQSWQWRLLHDRPNDEQSRFDFWWDVATCVETRGNAYIQKVKIMGEVLALYVIDPDIVVVKRRERDGRKVFVVSAQSGQRELTAAEVLHVRGPTLKGGDTGVTPIKVAADTVVGSALARYGHEAATFKHGAEVPYAIRIPDQVKRDNALEVLAAWKNTHGGYGNAGKPGILGSGADIVKLGLSMEDAQFIESHKFSVEDVARIFNLPSSMLAATQQGDIEQETTRFLSFGAKERLDRIRDAFAADMDFFGDSAMYPEHFTEDFVRLDAATRDTIYHQKVQDGRLLVDEARAEDGRPPLPNGLGQIPQITPVGGAPNPLADAANTAPGD